MIRLAEALDELLPANSQHGAEADVGDIGNFADDLWRLTQPSEVTDSDTEHFALPEGAELS